MKDRGTKWRLWLVMVALCPALSLMLGAASTNDHDGLGRLIRATSPHPSPETSAGLLRSERFYYDGIRRIQEVVVDSVASSGYAESSGIPGLIATLR